MTTLKLKETPQSCGECQLRGYNEALDYDDHEGYAGAICHGEKSLYMEVGDYLNTNTRHPDCPLKITEDNLRWNIYVKDFYGSNPNEKLYPCDLLECPKCHSKIIFAYAHCPSCGIKLLPPEEL